MTLRPSEPSTRPFRAYPLWVALCCLGTGALALVLSSHLCLWFDEFGTVQTSQRPFLQSLLQIEDYAAPLYQLILRAIWHHGLPPQWVVRAPALLSAVLGVLATAWLARMFFNPQVAALSVTIVAFNPVFIRYAAEGRPYSLFLLLSVLSIGTCWKSLHQPTRTWIGLHVLSSILLAYAHYFGFLVLFAEAVFCLLYLTVNRGRQGLRRMALVFVAIGLASLPSLWLCSRYVTSGLQGLRTGVAPTWGLKTLLLMNLGDMLFESRTLSVLCVWAMGVILLALLSSVRRGLLRNHPGTPDQDAAWGSLLCLIWFASSYYSLVVAAVLIRPYLAIRYVLPAMVPCALLLSSVVCKTTRRVQTLILLLVVVAYYPQVRSHLSEVRRDYPGVVAALRQSNPQRDRVYVTGCPDDPRYYRSILELGLRYYGYDEPNIALLEFSWNERDSAYRVREPRLLEGAEHYYVVSHWEGYAKPVEECLRRSSREYKRRDWGPGHLMLLEVNP